MAATRNILYYVLLVLLAAALGLGAYLMSAAGLGRNQLPMPFGVGLATVESNSMQPALSRGDLLVVGQETEPAVGDIVVYQDPSIGLVVHRVVALDGDLVTTQGDANNTADVPFDRSRIVGRVVAVVPALGLLVAALKTPAGVLVTLALALLLVELPYRRQRDDDEAERQRLRAEIDQIRQAAMRQSNDKEGSETDGKR